MAFNNDPLVTCEVERLRRRFNIPVAVETGTFRGQTTEYFNNTFSKVFTVEINPQELSKVFANQANIGLSVGPFSGVHFVTGDSAEQLPKILELVKGQRKLVYLDAHWFDDWPLKKELLAIGESDPDNTIVVIDDFKVPERDFQFDSYKEKACELSEIENELDIAFGKNGWFLYYNDSSLRAMKGVGKAYIIPKNFAGGKHTLKDFAFQENGVWYSNLLK